MKKGRWYLVFIFEDKLAHKEKQWISRVVHVPLNATEPEAAYKEGLACWEKKKGKKFQPKEPYEKGPLNPQIVCML